MTTPESPVTWIDFHTHVLDSPTLPEDALAARREGVGLWLVNSVDVQNWVQNKARATPYPEALVGVGWHPEHVIQVPVSQVDATLETLEKMIPDAPFLGETGLDFLYGKTVDQQAVQEKVFRRFIHWSNQTGKLLEVHSR
ncbi:MAG: TatD family hydrolase, partial [archaeon]|nr:TatD family hydrolase [archaeon]